MPIQAGEKPPEIQRLALASPVLTSNAGILPRRVLCSWKKLGRLPARAGRYSAADGAAPGRRASARFNSRITGWLTTQRNQPVVAN